MMPPSRQALYSLLALLTISTLVLWPGLGSSSRLSYHEAFVAQVSREMLDSGSWLTPTIGHLPWLEKPPLPSWLVALVSQTTGRVSELTARLPTTLAAIGLVLGVALLATRHYGRTIGLVAGAIQATTAWTAMRGRLAEADILLACFITWAIVTFDAMTTSPDLQPQHPATPSRKAATARWIFFTLLGTMSLVKGIGFGTVLVLSVVVTFLLSTHDHTTARRLCFIPGWILALILATAWPLAMLLQHGMGALSIWTLHVADRLATRPGTFASEPWWQYTWGILTQALPWTPLAFLGAWPSWLRATGRASERVHPPAPATVIKADRLLWAWAFAPMALLAMATVKNAHYAISAQVPWSIWAALGLSSVANRLERRGWPRRSLSRIARVGFPTLALAYGFSSCLFGPWFDRRGVEWGFYATAAQQLPADASLALLYDDWDRNPYDSPFGAIPHDLAVRLFYLGRPASWHFRNEQSPLAGLSPPTPMNPKPLYIIGRDRDTSALHQLGHVEPIAHGPPVRFDRTFTLFRVTPQTSPIPPRTTVTHRSDDSLTR